MGAAGVLVMEVYDCMKSQPELFGMTSESFTAFERECRDAQKKPTILIDICKRLRFPTEESYTKKNRCKIFFHRKDHQLLIRARVVHEAAHAVRGVIAATLVEARDAGKENQCITMNTPPTNHLQRTCGHWTSTLGHLYKMNDEKVHSGYIAEHILLGGITVRLERGEGEDADKPFALVQTVTYNCRKGDLGGDTVTGWRILNSMKTFDDVTSYLETWQSVAIRQSRGSGCSRSGVE